MVMQVLKLPQGLEPWTSTLPRWRSTTELWQPYTQSRYTLRALHAVLINSPRLPALRGTCPTQRQAGAPEVRKGGEYMTRLVKVNCTTRHNLRGAGPHRSGTRRVDSCSM